jgi:hypothetical protein
LKTFNDAVEEIEDLKTKNEINRDELFSLLEGSEPRGGADFGIELSAVIELLKRSKIVGRNQQIFFLTDAVPTVNSPQR